MLNKVFSIDDLRRQRLEAANIRGQYQNFSFCSTPHSIVKGIPYKLVRAWTAMPEPKPSGLLLFGPAGVGKTGLAVSAARERALAGDGLAVDWMKATNAARQKLSDSDSKVKYIAPVWFESWIGLTMRLWALSTTSGSEYMRAFDDILRKPEVLILDDIDVGTMTDFRESILYAILEQFSNKKRLILTMNRSPSNLVKHFGERIVDRLVSNFLCLYIEGKSNRQKVGRIQCDAE